MPMATIKQIVPASVPLWAVFADEKGEPLFVPCACVGTIAVEDKTMVVGFCIGAHLDMPDNKSNFISYADAVEPNRFRQRCQFRRKEMRESKIALPGDRVDFTN